MAGPGIGVLPELEAMRMCILENLTGPLFLIDRRKRETLKDDRLFFRLTHGISGLENHRNDYLLVSLVLILGGYPFGSGDSRIVTCGRTNVILSGGLQYSISHSAENDAGSFAGRHIDIRNAGIDSHYRVGVVDLLQEVMQNTMQAAMAMRMDLVAFILLV